MTAEREKLSARWNTQHERYAITDWIDKPSLFAQWALRRMPMKGVLLDIGCGQGQDARFFAQNGFEVFGVDFSSVALAQARIRTPLGLMKSVRYSSGDISRRLHFGRHFFDVVYSHLAIHYFDEATTRAMFDEFRRVLKPGGLLAVLVNSTTDPEIADGVRIEDDFYRVGDMNKRYFSPESIAHYASKFKILVADAKGETYKDTALGTRHLVRLIAEK